MSGRVVGALAWLQWRLLVNGLKGGRSRDSLERLSRIGRVALPVLLAVALVPLAAGMAALGGFAGWALTLPGRGPAVVVTVASLLLLGPLVWAVLRPLVLAGQGKLENRALLRLLPIPASLLRHLELLRAAADPMFAVFASALLLLPVGALAGGRPVLALEALVGGLLFLALVVSLAALASLATALLLRDRRRGELVMVVLFVLLSVMGFLPQALIQHRRERPPPGQERVAPPALAERERAPFGASDRVPGGVRVLPSGIYATVLQRGAAGETGGTAAALGLLAAMAAAAYAGCVPLHRRLLETPETSSSTRSSRSARGELLQLPGASPAVSAVAGAQVRLVVRSARGKMALVGPTVVTMLFALVFTRGGHGAPAFLAQPYGLAGLAAFLALSNLSVVSFNQLAIDAGGLMLQLLQPISDRELLTGKALGSGFLVIGSLLPALVGLGVLFPSASPALWLAALLGAVAAHLLLAPFAAVASAVFPRTADLGKLGRSGQPHGLAGLLALIGNLVALAPAAAITAACWLAIGQPWLAPLLVLVWLGIAVVACHLLLPLAGRVLSARRENLALVAVGR